MRRLLPGAPHLCRAVILVSTCFAFTLSGCSSSTSSTANNTTNDTNNSTTTSNTAVDMKAGNTAPDFEFKTIDGTMAKLSDYRGSVVILNFWASWCGYCVQEMPDMDKIVAAYPDVTVIAINRGDSTSTAISAAEKFNYSFVWGLDEDGSIETLYPADGIPYSIIIDANGTIVQVFNGSSSDMYSYFKSAVVKAGA